MLYQQYHDTFTHCIQILNFNALLLLLTASSILEKHIIVYMVSEVICANINYCQETQNEITPSNIVVSVLPIDYRVTADFDPHKRLFMFIFHVNKC